jgi:hypothetical protein
MAIDITKLSQETTDILRTSVEKAEIAKMVKKEKPKKKSKSFRPLQFDIKDTDTPIKRAIVEQINRRDLTYDDLKTYYASFSGDEEETNHGAYNLIETLRNRPGMMDKTISIILDFLEMDILFVSRNSDTVLASTQDLISRLQQCPERLPEIIELLKTEVGKEEERVDE